MQKAWTVIFILIVCILHASAQSHAEDPDVFQILTGGCPEPETLTGFRVEGFPGIVTALHGVVGCKKISALVGSTDFRFRDLYIFRADIERDLALLSGSELQTSSSQGLKQPKQESNYAGLSVYVIGYPLGIREQLISDLKIRHRPRRPLQTLIPPNLYEIMRERNSPGLEIDVLSIEGHLVSGHSGAPILNEQHQVIGIANGGLQSGATGIVWAIPWHDIVWKEVSQIRDDLSRLTGLRKPVSFSTGTSEDRLTLKIAFNDPSNFIIRDVYTDRSAQYLFPLPHDMNLEDIERFFIFDTHDTLLAQGSFNTPLSSPDKRFKFTFRPRDGMLVSEVTPKITYYDVILVLPSRMSGADVLVDGKSAIILERTPTFITIRVKEKETNHQITVIKDSDSCTTKQFIRQNNLKLYPCQ